ncbi:P-type conjugative transfer protein TrbG [Rhizorhabdus dicambivorans]|uniref:P-type conjugative transfer protein TrbG n=1 Tax=Rhizorhabdus dicambivorans TaxID=1850238 RepID=A0A2A4FSX0_9SPHN|nr:P-type conjugative transfer protein TrbG [Rhizorhabdus dicambivorans]ATE66829.1 P-type conjugative transfer protein TrbG [Rhizorhabdus dicambivorans]PCE40820.1 P-type conjugative transfer protein TrbG [Rhizorhabdus dicambivorans]
MIRNPKRTARILTLVALSASVAIVSPTQAKDQPAAPAISYEAPQVPNPSETVVAIPVPLPLPGQLKQFPQRPPPHAAGRSHPSLPRDRVGAAMEAARVQPERTGFVNAIQVFPYTEGALYQVYAKPGQVTDIALQEGEQLVGSGPVAAGDTVRWMIGDTVSGVGAAARVHILVKPIRPDIATNLVINTDRRTYHLELRANPSVYMASVSWTYPQDQLIALRQARAEAERAAPVAAGLDLSTLNFRYAIEGGRPDWRPLRAFDDGVRVFIEFPESIAQGELPPLFVIGAKGNAELVNYRVSGRYMIVDRLFARAELRLGGRKGQQTVRIVSNRRGRA